MTDISEMDEWVLEADEEEELRNLNLLSESFSPTGLQVITFLLGKEKYALDILLIRELITFTHITPIPNMPPFLKGMLNLRGWVIPVVDLRLRFGFPADEYNRYTVIIIALIGRKSCGFVIDTILDVINISQEKIQPPPDLPTSIHIKFIRGLIEHQDDLIILLDLEHIFDKVDMEEHIWDVINAKEEPINGSMASVVAINNSP